MTTPALDVKTKSGVSFGKELREKEFLFGEGYLNLNHGKLNKNPGRFFTVTTSFSQKATLGERIASASTSSIGILHYSFMYPSKKLFHYSKNSG
jgi:hypothetical protein